MNLLSTTDFRTRLATSIYINWNYNYCTRNAYSFDSLDLGFIYYNWLTFTTQESEVDLADNKRIAVTLAHIPMIAVCSK